VTPTTPAWAEVSLSALRHNFTALKKLAKGSDVLAVVKANAYGHGSVQASKAFIQAGAKCLAVAFVQEGVALRQAGIRVPILVLTPTLPAELPVLLKNVLTPQVSSVEGARQISKAAQKLGLAEVRVHVKLDTGMARVGFKPAEVLKVVQEIQKIPRVWVEGVYTHLATADWTDPVYAWKQITQFRQALEKLEQAGMHLAAHVANSAALLTYYPQSKGAWVRPGISLYGLYPNVKMRNKVKLIPVMQVRARILHVKTLEKGESVSYGRTYTAKKRIKVATIAMGYADGLLRSLSNKGVCLIKGKKAPFVGRVCMDMTMVDVSHVPGVKVGDAATLFGRDGKAFLPVEEMAANAGTISYEILCAIGERVPRVYLG
jgi:alanine racemase